MQPADLRLLLASLTLATSVTACQGEPAVVRDADDIAAQVSLQHSTGRADAVYSPESAAERTRIGCLILVDFVTRELDSGDLPLYLRDTAEVSPRAGGSEQASQAWLLEDDRLGRLHPKATCPELGSLRGAGGAAITAEPPSRRPDGILTYETLAVRLPHIDLERGVATFATSRECGPFCASGAMVTYEREGDGTWAFKREILTWIS